MPRLSVPRYPALCSAHGTQVNCYNGSTQRTVRYNAREGRVSKGPFFERGSVCLTASKVDSLDSITPIFDILADIQQKHADGEEVDLPAHSARDLTLGVKLRSRCAGP